MQIEYDKYIECPRCKIGGYDLCPECSGGGGYSIKVIENPSLDKPPVAHNRIGAINKRLDLLKTKGSITSEIEQRLHNDFLELSNYSFDIQVVDTLERLIKIRRTFSHQRIIREIKRNIVDVRKVVVNLEDDTEPEPFVDRVFRVREKRQLPFKNDFFGYKEGVGLLIKVTKTKWAKLSLQLVDNLIFNLFRHSVMDLDALHCTFSNGFEKEVLDKNYREKLFKIQTSKDDTFRSFLIQEASIREVFKSYFK